MASYISSYVYMVETKKIQVRISMTDYHFLKDHYIPISRVVRAAIKDLRVMTMGQYTDNVT